MIALKVSKVGNSTGVILPKEALERLHISQGDIIYLTETPDGYRLTPYGPDFAEQMKVAREVMKKRRNVLRELAK